MENLNPSSHFQGVARMEMAHLFQPVMRMNICGILLFTFVFLLLSGTPSDLLMAKDNFDDAYDKASLYFRQGKYEEALGQYKKANRMKQDSDLECLWGMAQTFSKLGAYKNTLQTCDRLIQLSGDNVYFRVKALNMRGNELSIAAMADPERPDQNKLREAETAYREVLKLSSALNVARYNLGITLIRMNRINEGIGELQAYVQNAEEKDIVEKAQKIIQNPRRVVENYAPDFSITTSDGEYISSDELRGKIILLDFWGVWCQPCISAIPFLSNLTKKYQKESFVLISVDVNDEEAKWRDCIEKNKMNWTHMRDGNNKIQRLFQVNAFPSYILIDHEGIIRYRGKGAGMQTENEVSNVVKKALKNLASSSARPEENPMVASTLIVSSSAISAPPDSVFKVQTPGDPRPEITFSGNEGGKTYILRIPKPIIEVIKADIPNLSSEFQNRPDAYRIQVRNWASMPDDLFQSSKNLMACSAGSMAPRGDFPPTRLEIIVKNEQGQVVRGFCDPPRPEILQSLMLLITNQHKPSKIYLELKDRLTGNAIQSDPVPLP